MSQEIVSSNYYTDVLASIGATNIEVISSIGLPYWDPEIEGIFVGVIEDIVEYQGTYGTTALAKVKLHMPATCRVGDGEGDLVHLEVGHEALVLPRYAIAPAFAEVQKENGRIVRREDGKIPWIKEDDGSLRLRMGNIGRGILIRSRGKKQLAEGRAVYDLECVVFDLPSSTEPVE